MSLLSGLFTELEKLPTPRFVVSENVARTTAPAPVELRQAPKATSRVPQLEDYPKLGAFNQHPPVKEHPNQPQHFILTAATASPEWLAARNAFYHHLMPCRACHAPTGRYCPAGAELRQRYEQTPMA